MHCDPESTTEHRDNTIVVTSAHHDGSDHQAQFLRSRRCASEGPAISKKSESSMPAALASALSTLIEIDAILPNPLLQLPSSPSPLCSLGPLLPVLHCRRLLHESMEGRGVEAVCFTVYTTLYITQLVCITHPPLKRYA